MSRIDAGVAQHDGRRALQIWEEGGESMGQMDDGLEPIVVIRYECPVCGGQFESKEVCQAGIDDFVPPDPLPLGARVRHKAAEVEGVVLVSEVRNLDAPHGHRHGRFIEIGGGGASLFHLGKGYDLRDLKWEVVPD